MSSDNYVFVKIKVDKSKVRYNTFKNIINEVEGIEIEEILKGVIK
jgi:hypothetical protein